MAITERYVEVIADWANSTSYTTTPLSLVKGSNGNAYYCILAHTSETGVKGRPVDGTNYATYWAACDGTATKPWTLTQAFATATVGDRVWIKAGTYNRAAEDLLTNAGLVSSPCEFIGYNTTIGDLNPGGAKQILRTNGNGPLITTDMPVIAYASTKYLKQSSGGFLLFTNLKITGDYAGYLVWLNQNSVMFQCDVYNASTNAIAGGITCDSNYNTVMNCGIKYVGAAGTTAAIKAEASGRIVGNYVHGGANYGIKVAGSTTVAFNTFHHSTKSNIFMSQNGGYPCIMYNTAVDGSAAGIEIVTGSTVLQFVVGNMLTDNATYGIDGIHANNGIFSAYNRMDRNGTGDKNLATDWLAATGFGSQVAADFATTRAQEYVAPDTYDYRLQAGTPGVAAGCPKYLDMGACQRQEPTPGGGVPVIGPGLVY